MFKDPQINFFLPALMKLMCMKDNNPLCGFRKLRKPVSEPQSEQAHVDKARQHCSQRHASETRGQGKRQQI
jgi:hypothetical protein